MPTAGAGRSGCGRPDGDLEERRRVDVPAEPPAPGQHAGGDGPVVRHEHLLQTHRLAAGGQQPGRVPVVDDLDEPLGTSAETGLGRALLLRHEDLEMEIIGEVDAAGETPQPVEQHASSTGVDVAPATERPDAISASGLSPQDVVLRLDAVHRQHQAVRHQVGEHPRARPAAAASWTAMSMSVRFSHSNPP